MGAHVLTGRQIDLLLSLVMDGDFYVDARFAQPGEAIQFYRHFFRQQHFKGIGQHVLQIDLHGHRDQEAVFFGYFDQGVQNGGAYEMIVDINRQVGVPELELKIIGIEIPHVCRYVRRCQAGVGQPEVFDGLEKRGFRSFTTCRQEGEKGDGQQGGQGYSFHTNRFLLSGKVGENKIPAKWALVNCVFIG